MGRTARRIAIATAAILAMVAAAPAWAAAPAAKAAPAKATPAKAKWPMAPGDMSVGNPNAPVRVVEYLSLTCPHCAHFNETVYPAFKAKYVDTGRVYYTVRELLTAPAQVAAAGFLMARCGDGSRYFAIVDQVFKSQSRWQSGQIKPIFKEIALKNGLTEPQFEACLVDEKANAALEARLEYATGTDHVQSTPAFFINGVLLDSDHVPDLAELDAAITKALAAKTTGGRR